MRRSLSVFLAVVFMAVFSSMAMAVTPDEVLSDPALEARARHISAGLRCMVCQNQSIDDSDADLAKDLRVLVRERLVAGDTDRQVVDFIVARYGEFVLLKPRFQAQTLLLWLAPVAMLLAGIGFIVFSTSRKRRTAGTAPLSEAEQAELAKALSDNDRSA